MRGQTLKITHRYRTYGMFSASTRGVSRRGIGRLRNCHGLVSDNGTDLVVSECDRDDSAPKALASALRELVP